MSQDDRHLFLSKTPPGPHVNRQKRFRKIFHFRKDIGKKWVSVVKDYADTFQRSQQLRGHSVSVVNEIILLWKK